jgi:3-oxoacyl-[acyl-carrier-protein] synthase I
VIPIRIRGRAAWSAAGLGASSHVGTLRQGKRVVAPVAPELRLGDVSAGAIAGAHEAGDQRPNKLSSTVLEALIDEAKLTKAELAETAIFVGTTTGVAASEEIAYLRDKSLGAMWKAQFLSGGPGRLAAFAAETVGAKGPCFTYTTACTATALGVVMATRMMRQGRARRAIVLGLDVLMRMTLEGFRLLQLRSKEGCRPFDKERDGLDIGEAVAAVVLEPGEGRFQMLDGAILHDQGHIAAGSTDGKTGATVMEAALTRSGVRAQQITAIKAHGTGTPTNDLTELRALRRVFGETLPPFTSLKSTFGHTLGASTALELAVWLWCLEAGFMPGTHGFRTPEPENNFVPVIEPRATDGGPRLDLFNSFGFGGTSVSFVVQDRGAR